jgi:membrane fusion protein, multidrug efflux system
VNRPKPLPSPFTTAITAALIGLAGCSKEGAGAASAPTEAPPATVTVAAPESREYIPTETLTGRIDAVDSVEIRARVSGFLAEVRFQAGQTVRKGDVLFVIDPRPFQAALQRAEADLESAKTRAAQADRDAARAEQMLKTKAISVEEADQRRTRLSEAKASVAVAEAALVTARLNVEYAEIRSPIDGRVSRALVTPGNNVSGVDGATTLLTTVVSVDPVYVYADLDESVLLRLNRFRREGVLPVDAKGRIEVGVGLADETGYPHVGTVESLDNRLDPSTGSLVLRAVLANPDQRFVPGLFARVSLPSGPKTTALFVPDDVLGTEQSRKFLYTVSASNTVEKKFVTTGPLSGGKRLVASGLTPTDRVVVNGQLRIQFPGQPVAPVQATNSPAR